MKCQQSTGGYCLLRAQNLSADVTFQKMRKYFICFTMILGLSGCCTIQHPDNDAHFKLVGEQLYLVVENKSAMPFSITSFSARLALFHNFIAPDGEVSVAASFPNSVNAIPRIVPANSNVSLEVSEFRMPDDKAKTVVRMKYCCDGRDHHHRLVLQGSKYIDEKLIFDRAEKKQKENVTKN